MTKTLFYLINWTWGILQNIVGGLVFLYISLFVKDKKVIRYKDSVVTFLGERWGGISLGMFIFLSGNPVENNIKHEYGHTVQSIMLGIFYLPIVGICSLAWATFFTKTWSASENGYYKFWTERWADKLGEVAR